MKTKLLKNSYVLPMTLFCSALTFSPLGVAQAMQQQMLYNRQRL